MIVLAFLELAAVVVVLYVSELIVYLPPGRVGMVLRGKRARLVYGWGFKSPWPWSAFYAIDDFHLQLGSKGAFAYAPHRVDSRKPLGFGRAYIDYKDIGEVTSYEHDVLVDGKLFVKAVSTKAAERMQRELEAVKRVPETKRDNHVRKQIEKLIDPDAAIAIRENDDKKLSSLRLFAMVHMLVLTTLTTMCVFGRLERWPWMLGALGTTLAFTVAQFALAHGKLCPEDTINRWTRVVTYTLAPVGVVKAADVVTRERMTDVHMFAAMRAFLPEAKVQPILALALRDTKHPGALTWTDPDPAAKLAQEEHRALVAQVLTKLVKEEARADEEGIVVRCPRCGAGYTKTVSVCFDCGATIEQAASRNDEVTTSPH